MSSGDKTITTTTAIPKQSLIHPDCAKSTTAKTPTAVNLATTDKQDNLNIRGGKGFLFDIIVIRLDISNKIINDPTKLGVHVNFNGHDLPITSSRINVLDFKAERSLEFVANPLTLKDELAKNPLSLKVLDSESVLGYGLIEWPESFLLALIECAGEMNYSAEADIKECDGSITGTIQVLVRLQPKCEEYLEDNSPDGKCRNANKEISPNDILFMVGEDKNNCCCGQVGIIPPSDSDPFLNPQCLDLSNFRAINSQNIQDCNILSSLEPGAKVSKTARNHYQELIDGVMNRNKSLHCGILQSQKQCQSKPSIPDCYQRPLQSSSDSCNQIAYPCLSEKMVFANRNLVQISHKQSPPNLVVNEPETNKLCPLCNENLSFLPKLAACPNCCYKPIPIFEEKTYNDEQTAGEILQNYSEANSNSDSNIKDPKSACRCTCKYGINKPCAHCRIKKLCEDIFQLPPAATQQNNCVKKSSDIKCASSIDDRPFLTRVFSELRDHYDIKDTKREEFQPNERCEKELNKGFPRHLQINKKIMEQAINECEKEEFEQQQECLPKIAKHGTNGRAKKRKVKPCGVKVLKSRLYDYQTICYNHIDHVGHKTCINGFAGRKNVPSHMGWLWNANNSGVHNKWKPGAIRKPIKQLMRYFLKDFPADTLLVSKYAYRQKGENKDQPNLPCLTQKPTLHISKKNGEYLITMRPLKNAETLKEAADPYADMKPVQFRIIKNPQLMEVRKLKQCLKDMGFRKCTCHKPIIYCYCRSFLDKKKLEYECNRECRQRNLPLCNETLILSDTSESEDEYDFGVTPPAGVIKPERLRKPNLINTGTQYVESDWNPQPLYPKPPNKYMQMYQCAVGERSGKIMGTNNTNTLAVSVGRNGGAKGDYVGKSGMRGAAIDFSGKYGGRTPAVRGPAAKASSALTSSGKGIASTVKGVAGQNANYRIPGGNEVPRRKVDMMKYIIKANKMYKLSPAEAAAKRKEKMRLLRGVNPPLLCTVDRRGKPFDPCAPCVDNRIC